MIEIDDVAKSFTLHNQGGARIPVLEGASLSVAAGECIALTGPSGSGKSTLMRMIYGNYLAEGGQIRVGGLDVVAAEPREILALRRQTLGYVSQFLRVVPRVPTIEVVAEPLLLIGADEARARTRAEALLSRLRIPRTLWDLSPLTFPAASSSGSTSPAALPMPIRHCCWMSRRRRWMPPTAKPCWG